ncbi:hypothetical protein DPMN_134752 [Dreissena polymorpha]|uniref:Uncharacterized protein n=1 Tax=Dreissena polymorpha TaxID=45954 RepID=A0A9D4FXW4_DREPO|nr:hypothetical protein DPMN_134752 [Dreissena polymorpha]
MTPIIRPAASGFSEYQPFSSGWSECGDNLWTISRFPEPSITNQRKTASSDNKQTPSLCTVPFDIVGMTSFFVVVGNCCFFVVVFFVVVVVVKKLYSCQDNLLWEIMIKRWKSVSLNNPEINSNKLKNKAEMDVRRDVSAEKPVTGPVNTDRHRFAKYENTTESGTSGIGGVVAEKGDNPRSNQKKAWKSSNLAWGKRCRLSHPAEIEFMSSTRMDKLVRKINHRTNDEEEEEEQSDDDNEEEE